MLIFDHDNEQLKRLCRPRREKNFEIRRKTANTLIKEQTQYSSVLENYASYILNSLIYFIQNPFAALKTLAKFSNKVIKSAHKSIVCRSVIMFSLK